MIESIYIIIVVSVSVLAFLAGALGTFVTSDDMETICRRRAHGNCHTPLFSLEAQSRRRHSNGE